MKQLLLAGLLALPLAAFCQQRADAWCRFNFGVGANIGFQSGGSKSVLWGLYQSSDTGPIAPHGGGLFPPAPTNLDPYGVYGGAAAGSAPAPVGGYGAGQVGQDYHPVTMGPATTAPNAPVSLTGKEKTVSYEQAGPRSDGSCCTNSGAEANQAPAPSYWYDN